VIPTDETAAPRRRRPYLLAALAGASTLAAVLAAALLVNVAEKKQQAKSSVVRVVELTDDTEDPASWGKNFPVEYDLYLKTREMIPTKHGGSRSTPHVPTEQDPRKVTSQSKVEADPRLKAIWAGYAFATDFREDRGHAYMLEDQLYTQRQIVARQPGACGQCHASVVVPMRKLGGGDVLKGFEALNRMPYSEAKAHFQHPVSCIDCHDPATMQLRVTRPAFLEGIRAYRASLGQEGYDPNKMATRQEMRAFVCGQCHAEYYFKGAEKRLTFPWSKGLQADEILAYYDELGLRDWTHKLTGAPALKAQHPEFELWSQGIHARSGVACADCHMPYMRVGGTKVSDHQVRSPLLNLNRACQSCHRWPEDELKARVEAIQDKHMKIREQAFDALVALVGELQASKERGAAEAALARARYLQRRAQFLFDFVEAENSTGFHAPQEAARVLFLSLDASRQGQLSLRDPAFRPSVAIVDIPPLPVAPAPAAPGATPPVAPAVAK
jgi:nitrite reductase (cytochrome c-552)